MIEYVEGYLLEQADGSCLVKTGPISLRIATPALLPISLGDLCGLFTSLLWKDTGPQLYGFLSAQDKTLFEELIKISGVGPKTALNAIKAIGGDGIKNALSQNDYASLMHIKGLGKKTAERIFLELKAKYFKKENVFPEIAQEACSTLIALGYAKKKAEAAIKKILNENKKIITQEELVRTALPYFKPEHCKSYTWHNHEGD